MLVRQFRILTTCTRAAVTVRRYHLSTTEETEFRLQLVKYSGGSVDVIKDNESGIATVRLNNPQKRNALSGKMMVDLNSAVKELNAWDEGKALILCGADNTFCSGGDLSTVTKILNQADAKRMCMFMQSTLAQFQCLPLVSVAMIEGNAIGGGAELITASDFRIMTNNAKIGFVQTKLNVTTGWGGGTRLVQMLGRAKALDLLLSGRLLDAQEAMSIGLVQHILPQGGSTIQSAKNWLSKYTKGTHSVSRNINQMVDYAMKNDNLSSLKNEQDRFIEVWGSDAHEEAINQNKKHIA